jgi:hypothetical protein
MATVGVPSPFGMTAVSSSFVAVAATPSSI